jgi:TatD DNase family protein
MLIDTHCHLDADEFASDRSLVIGRAVAAGVQSILIPAVQAANFDTVRKLAHSVDGGAYALGIHPMYVAQADPTDLDRLEAAVVDALSDPRFVAIGEIGLDFFLPELRETAMRERQERFYSRQLQIARRFRMPVLLHVRRSQDVLLKYLRAGPPVGGIAHAFNGSFQQAAQFIDQGFALGFGGTVTFSKSLQIRRLATQLALNDLVLETDAPDIPPAWLGGPGLPPTRNEPAQVARIAQVIAQLRGIQINTLVNATATNACRVIPRLAALLHR